MTTSAMILGAVPLILSNASGSESRRVIGSVLVGGLSLGTVLTLCLLPTLYVVIKGTVKRQAATTLNELKTL
jgi:multidrug efflux pump